MGRGIERLVILAALIIQINMRTFGLLPLYQLTQRCHVVATHFIQERNSSFENTFSRLGKTITSRNIKLSSPEARSSQRLIRAWPSLSNPGA